jgi:hypothetical protein
MSEDYCRCNRPLELKGQIRVCSSCNEPQDRCQCLIDRWWEHNQDLEYNDQMSRYHRDLEWRDREKPMREWQLYAYIGGFWAIIISVLVFNRLTSNAALIGVLLTVGVLGYMYLVNRLTKKHTR